MSTLSSFEALLCSVYLVQDSSGEEYALKTLRDEILGFPEIAERFVRETRIAASLDHPNIVRTYKTAQTPDGIVYMIAEYCPGGSTSEWLQKNGLVPVDTALKWMREAAVALSYMWREHGIIHRDIKPDNLLLDRDNRIKITDFGVAKDLLAEEIEITQEGNVLGTAQYLAPEQAAGQKDVDVRADLYGLGATFFELLSGSGPFDGVGVSDILTAKLFGRPPLLRTKNPRLPPPLCNCIDRLLARDPASRFETPEALIAEIDRMAKKPEHHHESS